MKLALLVEYYPPSRASAAIQMSDLAREFARQGHDVTVFTTSPLIDEPSMQEHAPELRVFSVPTAKTKGVGHVRRAISEILMSLQLWRGSRLCKVCVSEFDGIIWYSPTIFLAPFVAWLKRRSCARGYLILRDIFPQWALDAGVLQPGLAYSFFRLAERFQYRVADVIGVQSPANLVQVRTDARRSQQLEVLLNWTDLTRRDPPANDMVERYGLSDRRIVVYGGNMGVAQDVDNLVRLAERLRNVSGVRMLLVGAGSEVDRLRLQISDRKLTNVVVHSEIDPEEFRALLRSCHVGLITLDRRLSTHNIPGKLLAYLEAGLPVVASVNPGNDLLTILRESGAGLGVINGDDAAFADAVLTLANSVDRCELMSRRARALATERFSVEKIAAQLIRAFAEPLPVEPAARAGQHGG